MCFERFTAKYVVGGADSAPSLDGIGLTRTWNQVVKLFYVKISIIQTMFVLKKGDKNVCKIESKENISTRKMTCSCPFILGSIVKKVFIMNKLAALWYMLICSCCKTNKTPSMTFSQYHTNWISVLSNIRLVGVNGGSFNIMIGLYILIPEGISII